MIAGIKWSKSEKRVAKEVFERAYQRECDQIIDDIKTKAKKLKNPEDIWDLCDVLVKRRKEIDQKYDYRYSQLPFIFGLLLRDKLIGIKDLEGLVAC